MHLSFSRLFLFTLFIANSFVASQNAQDEKQIDPSAQCDQDTRDSITSCLDQVEQDESKLSSGPCSSSDWKCICTKQQGMVDCYSACSGLQPVDMVNFNNENCKGQHGATMKAEGGDLTYSWSMLPFTSSSTQSANTTAVDQVTDSKSSADSQDAGKASSTVDAATATSVSTNVTPAISTTSSSNTTNNSSTTSSKNKPGTKDEAAAFSSSYPLLFGITFAASSLALIAL